MLITENYESELAESMKATSIREFTGKYKRYGERQIIKLIKGCEEEDLSICTSAIAAGVPPSSANILVKRYNKASNGILPTLFDKKPWNSKKLFPEHTEFLVSYFDENPSATIEQAKNELFEKFKGLEISISGLQKHIKTKYALTLKQAERYTMDRDSSRTIGLRFNIITEWKKVGADFMKKYVFIGGRLQFPYDKKSRTVKGCKVELISQADANTLEQEYAEQNFSKKRKVDNTVNKDNQKLKKGTRAYHVVTFIHSVMDVLDRHDKKISLLLWIIVEYILVNLL
ncbi:unnamed protein product [Cunninghamella echinulata]